MNNMDYQFPFEKLEIWNLSLNLSEMIYKVSTSFPKSEMYGITSQITRAANSVSANIAEGVARFSQKEKCRFIEISYGSLMEVANFLFVSKRLNFISEEQFINTKPLIIELGNKINAYYKFLNKNQEIIK